MKLKSVLKPLDNFPLTPENRLYIDVGTSIDAPNSAEWILKDEKSAVIGIEPYKKNFETLKEGRDPLNYSFPYLRLKDKSILQKGKVITQFENPYAFLNCAIDLVPAPKVQDFYCTGDVNSGCSSLLEPIGELKEEVGIEKVQQVMTLSLQHILSHLQYDDFIYVLKTDTQGKDFDVVQSMGPYLMNALVVVSEYNTHGMYKGEGTEKSTDFRNFMEVCGFALYKATDTDFIFVNNTAFSQRLSADERHFVQHILTNMNFATLLE